VLKKLREEFDMHKQAAIKEKPELASMTIEKQLEELVTLDTVLDFDYLSHVMQEVLRY